MVQQGIFPRRVCSQNSTQILSIDGLVFMQSFLTHRVNHTYIMGEYGLELAMIQSLCKDLEEVLHSND